MRDFALRDQDGTVQTLRRYRGRIVILTFLYSTCQDTCPVAASTIRAALDDLPRDVPVLAVSVDPRNDTPQSAKRFLLRRSVNGRMQFLLGTQAQLAPVWKAYGIKPQLPGSPSTDPRYEHSARILLLDRTGRQRVAADQEARLRDEDAVEPHRRHAEAAHELGLFFALGRAVQHVPGHPQADGIRGDKARIVGPRRQGLEVAAEEFLAVVERRERVVPRLRIRWLPM